MTGHAWMTLGLLGRDEILKLVLTDCALLSNMVGIKTIPTALARL